MATPEQVAALATANATLAAQVRADLERFWRYVDLSSPERAVYALANYVPLLVQRYGETAATLAADWYELLRLDAVDAGLVRAIGRARSFQAIAADPDLQRLHERLRSASNLLWTPEPERTREAVALVAQQSVLQAGRDTIMGNVRRDRAARGWQRFTSPTACRFCVMLSSRGGVYTDATSRFAAHDDCNCTAAPVWDPSAPKVDVAAEFVASPRWEVLRRLAAAGDPQAIAELERRRAQVREYMARMPDDPEAAGAAVYDRPE